MARLFWLLVMLALGAAVVGGVSWVAAYATVGKLLGSPPPAMGTQTTRLVWKGIPRAGEQPWVWLFAFGPTRIPGAPRVRIHVGPTGELIRTEPPDLDARIKAFHNTGY